VEEKGGCPRRFRGSDLCRIEKEEKGKTNEEGSGAASVRLLLNEKRQERPDREKGGEGETSCPQQLKKIVDSGEQREKGSRQVDLAHASANASYGFQSL